MAAVQAQTVFINKDWQTSSDITDTTNPFVEVDTQVLIEGFGTIAFPDPPFVPGLSWDTEFIRFAGCAQNNYYSGLDLEHVEHDSHVTISTVSYKPSETTPTYGTTYVEELDNHDRLIVVGDHSNFAFGWVTNEIDEEIKIIGNDIVFSVIPGIVSKTITDATGTHTGTGVFDNTGNLSVGGGAQFTANEFITESGTHQVTISGSNTTFIVTTVFENAGFLFVKDGAYFEADTIENDVGGHTVSVTGSNTVFKVDSEFDNIGKLTVGTGAYFESKSFKNTDSHVVEISGSNTFFKVIESFTDNGVFSVTGGAKFEAGSFTIGNGKNLIVSDSEFTVTGEFTNGGVATITGSTVKANKITQTDGHSFNMDGSSQIITNSFINGTGWGSINVNVNGFSGTQKILDVNDATSGPALARIILTGTGSENIRVISIDGDISITSESGDILYVNSAWSGHSQGDKVGESRRGTTVENLSFGNNAFAIVNEAVTKEITPPSNKKIMVVGGSYGTSNAPTFDGIDTTIQDGTFGTSVCGGKLYAAESVMNPEDLGNISFKIDGGTFEKAVFAGDRVNKALCAQSRTGNIEVTISGGVFKNAVAGAMALTSSASTASAELIGDVSLTITGGTFVNDNNKSWIYGGSLASTKAIGANTTIMGNVTVTLDAKSGGLTIANLVVGSFGAGKIGTQDNKKDAKLVLTGNHDITATGEIWGGCSSDIITVRDGKRVMKETQVSGNRILSFTGFQGTLTSTKIRAFSHVELKKDGNAGNSIVNLVNSGTASLNLSEVENWSFESGSSLTGDFINDFEGDTLNLTGFTGSGTFNLMSDSNASNTNDIFNGFEALGEIQLNGVTQTKTYSSTDTTMTWAFDGGSVVVNKTTGTMSFIA